MGLKIADPLSLSCTQSNANLEQLYPTLSIFIQQHSDVHGKVNTDGYCPENHMKRIWETQKLMCSFIYDEHQHSDEEHNNILMVKMFT